MIKAIESFMSRDQFRQPRRCLLPLFLLTICFVAAGYTSGPMNNTDQAMAKPAATQLRVMAYNIHHCNPPSKAGFIDIEAIAKVINDESPDLVALQEVDVHTLRSGEDLHQAAALAGLTGMHYYFKKGIDFEGGEYGVAVLSKFPIKDTLGFALPMIPGIGGEPRAVAAIKVKLPSGRLLTFASTHLDLNANRSVQTAKIVAEFTKDESLVIIAGDFNDIHGSGPIATMDAAFSRTCPGSACPGTIPVENPDRVIDYIFYRPHATFRVMEHRVIAETYASDHLPVLAVLEVVD